MNGAEVVRRIKYFNPLPLYRGRHAAHKEFEMENLISIHFLYTEEDRKYQQMNILHQDILYLILTYKR